MERELAGLGRRFLACLIDGWILVFLDTFLGWVSLIILVGPEFSWREPTQIDLLLTKLRLFILPLILFLLIVNVGYSIYLLIGNQGQTLGKMFGGIRVVGVESNRIGYRRVLVRVGGYFFSAVPLGLGFFWALLDKQKQTWHDKLAGTLVINS